MDFAEILYIKHFLGRIQHFKMDKNPILENRKINDHFKKLHWNQQLYTLYGKDTIVPYYIFQNALNYCK